MWILIAFTIIDKLENVYNIELGLVIVELVALYNVLLDFMRIFKNPYTTNNKIQQ